MRRIPLIGESVLIVQATSGEGKPEKRNSNTTYYYLNPVSIQKNPHNNSLPTSKTLISVTNVQQDTQQNRWEFQV